MRLVIDIEANALENPTIVWLIVCKDIDTGQLYIYRNSYEGFKDLVKRAREIIGHNIVGYDLPVLSSLLDINIDHNITRIIDTLIISKLVDYSRENGHSIEAYGEEFGLEKIKFSDFSRWSQEMEDYCVRDVEITHRVYDRYKRYVSSESSRRAIDRETSFQFLVNSLHNNGFAFDRRKCASLLDWVTEELAKLDKDILANFPPQEKLIREFVPKATKFGTISKTSVPRSLWDNISKYEVGQTYRHTKLEEFNPASHKQIIEVLTNAGWRPVNKTKTHLEVERTINRLKYNSRRDNALDIRLEECYAKLPYLKKYGWKIDEANLSTLPSKAPSPARTLAKRILFEARRRTLTEWLGLVRDDDRIHGTYYGIGAWTHRMAHQRPNTANIPQATKEDGSVKLLGKEMRQLWRAPKNRLLVGVDAEGIQLRIFAHYIDEPEFTEAIVNGRKDNASDPHSLNQRVLGDICKTRQAAKRFIYALLLGAGLQKLAEILDTTEEEAKGGLDRLLARYQGFARLKKDRIPSDARAGWFMGLDGWPVKIPGDTQGQRSHLCMSGYLQNGEATIMKLACLLWHEELKDVLSDILFVNFVHDEWQTEVLNDMKLARRVAKAQTNSIVKAGELLKLKCPLAGSYSIGTNWYETH